LSVIFNHNNGISPFAYANDDVPADDDDALEEEANVEESPDAGDLLKTGPDADGGDADDDAEAVQFKPSPDVDTYFLFTKPVGMGLDLLAGKDVHFLVGFANKGTKDFYVDTMDASFRYAQDFSFHLQYFTAIAYNRVVKPKHEVTLAYQFFVSEAFSTRPYGLTVNLFYRDSDGTQFLSAVFNETVSIVELDEGLDGETFFLYVFLAACLVLIVVAAHQFLTALKRKHIHGSTAKRPTIETGTTNTNDVDYDWVPQETLNSFNKSPKVPKQSPRQRKVKRGTGAADD